jgi:spermidine synthase
MWIQDAWDKRKGRTISIKALKKIESYRSKLQTISVYDSVCFGRVLVIDNTIMLTEFDEFAYHEMIAHVALHVHPDPGKVLVIGGGDGGTIREILKHDVKSVVLCEIDEHVIRMSKKHFPKIAAGYADPRVEVVCEDGAEYVRKRPDTFDIIIVDSTDPVGPGEVLFKEPFYRSMFESLTKEGIAVTQSESMFYESGIIKSLFQFNRKIFPIARYYYTLVPTYPSGTIGFSLCSKKYDPVKDIRDNKIPGLRYYNSEVHKAAFVLPQFVADAIR